MAKGSRARHLDPLLPLDGKTREQLQAVVLDANAYGYAKPDLTDLEHLALRLHEIGIETWVPEPVAWEWAQHLAEDWHAVTTAASDARRNLVRGRIPMPEPMYKDAGEVIEVFMAAIRHVQYVHLIKASPENALEGLKDQVMLRLPGKRKENVKTGASDSTWLRDVRAAAGTFEHLLFLTADRDIANACDAWGFPAPLTRTRQELRSTLFNVAVDDGHATRAVVRYLMSRLPLRVGASNSGDTLVFDIGNTSGLDRAIEAAGEADDERVYGSDVTRLTSVVGLIDVTVEAEDRADPDSQPRWWGDLGSACHHQVTATVFFLGDAEATVNRLHMGGDAETDTIEYEDVLVRTELAFHFTDGVITRVSAESDAEVTLPSHRYEESYFALDDLREALSLVPGLVIPDDLDANTYHGEHCLKADGFDTDFIFTWLRSDYWRFRLKVETDESTDSFEVSCEYDATAWAGGSDGFHIWPPYYPNVEDGDLSYSNPIWSVPAWIIKHLDWSRDPIRADTSEHNEDDADDQSASAPQG